MTTPENKASEINYAVCWSSLQLELSDAVLRLENRDDLDPDDQATMNTLRATLESMNSLEKAHVVAES